MMNFKHFNADCSNAWPTAEIAVMEAKSAVEIIFRGKNVEQETATHEHAFVNLLKGAGRRYVDDTVIPTRTCELISDSLKVIATKKKTKPIRRHNKIPSEREGWTLSEAASTENQQVVF